jgi:nucleotide-binding universal stress UspA family protein
MTARSDARNGEMPMRPFKKILVPVDFSPHSDEAIRTVADLARRYEASVTLAHVYEVVAYALPEGYVLQTATQLADMLTEFSKLLAAAKAKAEAAGAPRVETIQLQGSPAWQIVDFATSKGFDLIVMGTHGRTGLKHALIGSVAERVVRLAPCPVLTVRAPEK